MNYVTTSKSPKLLLVKEYYNFIAKNDSTKFASKTTL